MKWTGLFFYLLLLIIRLKYVYIIFYPSYVKCKYASVVWNSITSTDANKLERFQQQFSILCLNCFCPPVHYSCAYALGQLNCSSYEKEVSSWCALPCSKFTFIRNSVHLFCKMSVFEVMLGISETFLCSTYPLKLKTKLRDFSQQANYTDRATAACRRSYQVQIVFPVVVFLLLMLFSGTLSYFT
jgi:hypothetical protein